MTRFSVLAALWAVSLALLLEPALVQLFALDPDVALALGAGLTSALVAALARERGPYAVPVLAELLVVVVVLVLAKPLRLWACEGEWCLAEDSPSLSAWLWLAVPGGAALGVALAYALRALTPGSR